MLFTARNQDKRRAEHTAVCSALLLSWFLIISLDYNCQVHAWVNRTVIMECTCLIERTEGCAIVATELYIICNRCAAFRLVLLSAAYPTAIVYFMWHRCV